MKQLRCILALLLCMLLLSGSLSAALTEEFPAPPDANTSPVEATVPDADPATVEATTPDASPVPLEMVESTATPDASPTEEATSDP